MLRRTALALAIAVAACGPANVPPRDAGADAVREVGVGYEAGGTSPDAANDAARDAAPQPTVDVTSFDATTRPDAAPPPPFDAGASGDAPAERCALLGEQYAAELRDASRCTSGSECTTLVCETPCCTCQVYASGSAAQLESLMRVETAWRAAGCSSRVACPAMPCDPAVVAECSSTGRCTTIRRPWGG